MKFTSENFARLQALFLHLCFAGEAIFTKLGAATLNPFEVLNQTSLNSLKAMLTMTQKSADEYAKVDRWSADSKTAAERERLQTWVEFIDLTIGYRHFLAEKADTEKDRAKKVRELAELKKEAKTPAERIAELELELA